MSCLFLQTSIYENTIYYFIILPGQLNLNYIAQVFSTEQLP